MKNITIECLEQFHQRGKTSESIFQENHARAKRGTWPQNPGSKLDAFPDRFYTASGGILAARMASKSKPKDICLGCSKTTFLQALCMHC